MPASVNKFLVVAASCRSIVRSITQAGYPCAGIDLFADADTTKLCQVTRVANLKSAIAETQNFDDDYQVVVGAGVDNEILGMRNPFGRKAICGISGTAMQMARDPFFVASRLQDAGIRTLQVRAELSERGNWIRKSCRSGGGHGVQLFRDGQRPVPVKTEPGDIFFQQFIDGPVFGATFVACRSSCKILGMFRQNFEGSGPDRFVYRGSAGPIYVPRFLAEQLEQMGQVISSACGLRGWFGIDFVLRKGVPLVLEVNPRYTASMEILERFFQHSLFANHLTGVQSELGTLVLFGEPPAHLGKRYLFWREPDPVVVGNQVHEFLNDLSVQDMVFATDIPCVGTEIRPGSPVCTVWARDDNERFLAAKLHRLETQILALLQKKTVAVRTATAW